MGLWARIRDALSPRAQPRASAYDAATRGYRLSSLHAPGMGPNAAIQSAGELPRWRVNALARNNPWAQSALETYASNAVGTGVQPQSQHPDRTKRREINGLHEDWAVEADADGVNDLYGLQWLVALGVRQGGDVFVLKRPRFKADGLTVPLQLQILGSEMLPYWKNEDLGPRGRIVCGIEFGPFGNLVGYHFLKEHPGEHVVTSGETTFKKAADVAHCFRRTMPGQVRGEWGLIRAIMLLNDLDEYEAAELMRHKGAAMFGGVAICPDPEKAPGMFGRESVPNPAPAGGGAPEENDLQRLAEVTMEPGTFATLPPGWDLRNFEPADVGANSEGWLRHVLRKLAKACGLTYEQTSGDMTGTSYSSARVSLLEFRRNLEPWQWQVIVHQFCRPVWRWFLDAAVSAQAIDLPDYATNTRANQRVTWSPQGFQWVDPLKEATAAVMLIRAGLKSRTQTISEMGFDPEVVEREITEENQRADSDLRVHDTDPRKVTQTGIAVSVSTGDADEGGAPTQEEPRRAASGGRRG